MCFGSEDPAHLGLLTEFRLQSRQAGEDAHTPDELAVVLALGGPGAEAVELPAADSRQQAAPAFLRAHGLGPEVPMHLGMLQERVVRAEVILPPRPQAQALGL